MALTSIKKNNEKLYDFEYYNLGYPEFNHTIEDKKIKYGFDFWGYANNQPVQTTPLKINEVNRYKLPNFGGALSGALKTVTHKTGGTTKITYEPHTVKQQRHAVLHGKPVNRRVYLYTQGANADDSSKEKTYTITFTEKRLVKIKTFARVYDHNTTTKISLKRQYAAGETDHHAPITLPANGEFFSDKDQPNSTLSHSLYTFVQNANNGDDVSSQAIIPNSVGTWLNLSNNPPTIRSATPLVDVTIKNTNNHGTVGNPINTIAKSDSESPYFEINPGTYILKVTTNKGGMAGLMLDYNNGLTTDHYNQEYGGIRVSTITTSPNTTAENDVLKKYHYNDQDGFSTGAVISSEDNLIDIYYLKDHQYEGAPTLVPTLAGYPRAEDHFSNPNVFKMHVKDRGLPVFYTKVSETINPTIKTMNADGGLISPIEADDCHSGIVSPTYTMNANGTMVHSAIGGNELLNFYQPTEGYTTYEFETPYQFKNYRGANLQFIYRYHEPPKGIDRAGIKLVKQSVYKGSEQFDFVTTNKVSEQSQVYEKVMLAVNTLEQSTDANYPPSLRVTSNGIKFMKNVYHVVDPGTPQALGIFKDKYKNATMQEYLTYSANKLTDNTIVSGSPAHQTLLRKVETNSIGMVNNVNLINCYSCSNLSAPPAHEATRASYVLTEYKEVDVDFRQKSMSTVNYFTESTARSMSGSSDVTYDAKGQMKTATQTDSQGNVTLTKYYYPYDIATTVNQALVTANAISQPVKTEVYLNNVLQSTSEVEFGAFVINTKTYYLPKRVKSSKENGTLESTAELVKYDASGNLLEFKQDNGLSTIFVWGYNDTKLLAKIENASYSALSPDLTNLINSVKSLSDNDTTAAAETTLRNELNKLRAHSQLANAQLSTYTYDPYIGVTSITDVRGYTTYYSYDNQHRLKYLKDEDGNVLEAYNYNFKTNQ